MHQRINGLLDRAEGYVANPLDRFSRWSRAKPVLFSPGGKPLMPEGIPPKAGVYHVMYNDGSHYFGEAFNLRRRLIEHCEAPTSAGDRKRRDRIIQTRGACVYFALQTAVREVFAPGERRLMEETYQGAAKARRVRENLEADALRKREPTAKIWAGREQEELNG